MTTARHDALPGRQSRRLVMGSVRAAPPATKLQHLSTYIITPESAAAPESGDRGGMTMPRAEIGSTVTISYIGTLDSGRIFHSTEEHGPLTVVIGDGQIFPALERAIIGMMGGETKNIVLSADDAYGPRRRENIITVSRQAFPAGKEIVVGQKVNIEFRGGKSRVMLVAGVTESDVTLDGNHPLAGRELTFALRVDRVEHGLDKTETDEGVSRCH